MGGIGAAMPMKFLLFFHRVMFPILPPPPVVLFSLKCKAGDIHLDLSASVKKAVKYQKTSWVHRNQNFRALNGSPEFRVGGGLEK